MNLKVVNASKNYNLAVELIKFQEDALQFMVRDSFSKDAYPEIIDLIAEYSDYTSMVYFYRSNYNRLIKVLVRRYELYKATTKLNGSLQRLMSTLVIYRRIPYFRNTVQDDITQCTYDSFFNEQRFYHNSQNTDEIDIEEIITDLRPLIKNMKFQHFLGFLIIYQNAKCIIKYCKNNNENFKIENDIFETKLLSRIIEEYKNVVSSYSEKQLANANKDFFKHLIRIQEAIKNDKLTGKNVGAYTIIEKSKINISNYYHNPAYPEFCDYFVTDLDYYSDQFNGILTPENELLLLSILN